MSLQERLAAIVIASAGAAALLLAVYYYGAGAGRPQPLPAKPWKHSVAFRLHAIQMKDGRHG